MASIHLENACLDFPVFSGGLMSALRRRHDIETSPDPRFLTNARGVPKAFRALDNVTLSIGEGDRVGIIGRNGSGKSTILRLISGIFMPTEGQIEVTGAVQAMFDLQIGVQFAASGYQNIKMIGLMRGFSRAEIKERIPEIVEFSGLGDFIHMPVKTYSTGMRTRLLFSTITALDPEVLLLDEWFGTADEDFNKRAGTKMKAIVERSGILMLASHSMPLLQKHCNKCLWLHDGHMRAYGETHEVLASYREWKK